MQYKKGKFGHRHTQKGDDVKRHRGERPSTIPGERPGTDPPL